MIDKLRVMYAKAHLDNYRKDSTQANALIAIINQPFVRMNVYDKVNYIVSLKDIMDKIEQLHYLKELALDILDLYEESELSVINARDKDVEYPTSDLAIKINEIKNEINEF